MKIKSNLNKKNKSVMIIGGGITGMACAQTLNDHGIDVHLIEKSDCLGGHASTWACMATDTCQHCSACLSPELSSKILQTAEIHTHLNTEVIKIDPTKKQYTARLKGGTNHSVEVEKIILATGFTPTEPESLIEEKYHSNKNIITTADLNRVLKNNTLSKYFNDTDSPEIGFIQCVGSRNRERGRDYCSQVCCKISLRHINKLIHLYPDAKISLFYIDLQIIGKETRAEFDALANNVELIQGVPFEIFDDKIDKKLSVIKEDSKTGNRIADHFDMMVLSVGIKAPGSTSGLSKILNIPPDQWGFINNHNLLAKKNIYAAGCAAGPVDILTAKHQGINCANQVIQSFNKKELQPENLRQPPASIAIIGDGDEACKTALMVLRKGYNVWMFGFGNKKEIQVSGIHYIPDVKLFSINGAAGDFTICYNNSDKTKQEHFAAIIVAEPAMLLPAGEKTDLPPEMLYSLKRFSNTFQNDFQNIPQTLVFWLDYSNHEFKTFSEKALEIAIELAKTKKSITFIMNKMLVHGLKGQQLYDRARKQGIKFLRTDSLEDVKVRKENKKIVFDLKEKTLKNICISFECDWLIIPENILPGRNNSRIAELLKIQLDTEGYLQSANVRHRLTDSPRKGIFFTGSCHDETDKQDQNLELELILSSIAKIENKETVPDYSSIEIDTEKCIKCLVCFRICPHGAIILQDGISPYIVPDACFSCGLCLSECPAVAIESKEFSDRSYLPAISKDEISIFACERSGALAAKQIKHDTRFHIQKVPCVCRISTNILLKMLETGAKKILLAGCHHNNCRSIKGSQKAQVRTKLLGKLPGIDNHKIAWYPVAANESAKFEEYLAQEFYQS